MPRFFFNVQDGKTIVDNKGIELPDWTTARLHAISLVGRILAAEPERIAVDEDWLLEVLDEAGLVLFRLDFHVAASPGVRNDRLSKREVLIAAPRRLVADRLHRLSERINPAATCYCAAQQVRDG